MINELLGEGKENARTGKYLADILGINPRDVTQQIERERRDGQPICATCNSNNPGYYLTSDPEELEHYCSRLCHRGGELFKTRRALLKTLQALLEKEEAAQRG